jgi:hypothetical protein
MSTGGFSGAFKKKKRIVATVVIAGQQYRQTVETDNIKLNLKDVKVVVEQNSSKPTIRIILP